MDIEKIAKAKAVLNDERCALLEKIAGSINIEKAANKKVMSDTMEERMQAAHRQKSVIDELCNDFDELLQADVKKRTRGTKG